MIFKRRIHGLGFMPQSVDLRDYSLLSLNLKPKANKGLIEVKLPEPPVYDQGSTNSCVAQAIGSAINCVELSNGLPLDEVSRRWLYYRARSMHYGQKNDAGTYIRCAATVMTKIGIPSEKYWSWQPNKVNQMPDWNSHMQAYSRRGGKYAFITSSGDWRVNEIIQALDNNLPVVFGTQIDKPFLKDDLDSFIDVPQEKLIGGHALLIYGYKRCPTRSRQSGSFDDSATWGATQFYVQNSWGVHWRSAGRCILSEDYIKWNRSTDFMVITGWNRLHEGVK